MAYIFDKFVKDMQRKKFKPRSKEAREWLRSKIKELGKVDRYRMLNDPDAKRVNRPQIGSMYMYFYNPKLAKVLPYYDVFPLILMVGPAEGGFYGMNLHYLSPVLRAKFLDKLDDTLNNTRYNDSTKFKLTYQLLKGAKRYAEFAPCFKHYLTEHVESKIVRIEPNNWETAIWLPTEQFAKKRKDAVWAESRRMIGIN